MSALLAPETAQIVRELDKLGGRATVLGLKSPSRQAWPSVLERGGRLYHLAWCESALEIRERLDGLDDQGREGLVVLTPLDDTDLGDDIRARLYRGRLERTDRWAVLRAAFQVRDIDPRLRRQSWLADLLISHAPVGGFYAPAAGGVLDWETAWAAFREHGLRMTADAVDLVSLIEWTLDGVGLTRLIDLPVDAKTAVFDRLAAGAGPGARPLLGAAVAGRGDDVLAIGLVCGVLFGGKDVDPQLRDAAVRLEPMIGGEKVDAVAGQALAAAARRVLQRLTQTDPPQARASQSSAETILAEVRAEDFAALSPALDIGLEARMRDAARALVRAAESQRDDDADHAWKLVARAQWPEHDRARDHPQRVDRLQMAARLACWLATEQPPPPNFMAAAASYASDSGFSDWARSALKAGDPLPEVAAAYGRLRDVAAARRETENHRFAQALMAWNRDGSPTGAAAPIETLLDLVVAPLARQAPVLLVVLDGLSFPAWRELAATLPRLGWTELRDTTGLVPTSAVAGLPTVTEISRASLFCGRLVRGLQAIERNGLASHSALVATSHAGKPPLLFHKAELGPGPELASAVAAATEDRQQRVVAVVHNAIDAQLSGSDQLEFSWTADALRQVAALLRLARDAGRVVVVTGDHGHVLEAGTALAQPGGGGDRWRPAGDATDGEILLTGGRVLSPQGGPSIIAAWSERLRYAAKHNGYHGGASPQEVLVPVAVLCAGQQLKGWDAAPPSEPTWWRGARDMLATPSTVDAPAKPVGRRGASPTPQTDLFAEPPPPTALPERAAALPSPPWISALFTASAYEAQRRLAGRGAPPDDQVLALLVALSSRGGRLSRSALAQTLSQPMVRIGGMVSAARRLLNLDQAQVLTVDGEDVVLDERLLKMQFQLEGRQ